MKLILKGTPSDKQKELFLSRAKYTAYGGARGGGKSWALRRKLLLMCLHYPGLKCLLIRRSYGELMYNHILPLRAETDGAASYSETQKRLTFPNGSFIKLGYLSDDGDTLQYQGLEFDVIALDEATQITEYQFNILKACLRGINGFPKRMYLTCNPGGVGHAWVKRLFIDRSYREGEEADDHLFIQATIFDNKILLENDAEYVNQLKSLPPALKDAWLYGKWDVFSGQFFPEFCDGSHIVKDFRRPVPSRVIGGLDYGFDAAALVLICADRYGKLTVFREFIRSDLTLSAAAKAVAEVCGDLEVDYIAASPDLWNRRQDSGISGYETMSRVPGMPPLIRADNRRVAGWRAVREYLDGKLFVDGKCNELIRCMSSLIYDKNVPEDCSGQPHDITHLPEALRYAVMSRVDPALTPEARYEERKRRYENRNSVANY